MFDTTPSGELWKRKKKTLNNISLQTCDFRKELEKKKRRLERSQSGEKLGLRDLGSEIKQMEKELHPGLVTGSIIVFRVKSLFYRDLQPATLGWNSCFRLNTQKFRRVRNNGRWHGKLSVFVYRWETMVSTDGKQWWECLTF